MTIDAPGAVAGLSSRDELKNALPDPTRAAFEYEESQWATGSVLDDPFYTVPQGSEDAAPGTLIKIEKEVNTSLFTIPPATALSRFVFQSKTLNGSAVPASEFVLWSYSPRSLLDGFQIKSLAALLRPYQLALQGYVVVAVDYAGLGVEKDGSGKQVVHEYVASPSHANDVFYGVQAAQSALPELSQKFVVIGHSQGGGAAWAAAQRQALDLVKGYLGAVAVAPVTKVLAEPGPLLGFIVVAMLPGIAALFPNFQPKDILTPEGAERLDLIAQIGECFATGLTLLTGVQLLKSDWTDNPFVQEYQKLTVNGGKKIEGPLVVIHGEADSSLSVEGSTKAVIETLELLPSSQPDSVRLPGISHVPALTASQRLWMDWIGDRFAGFKGGPKHNGTKLASARSISSYQPELNWFIEQVTQFYQTP